MVDAVSQFFSPVEKQLGSKKFAWYLGLIALLYLTILQASPTMIDADGFFHARLGVLTAQQGFVTSFPYLPETILANSWTDHHWLYHLFLVPFVTNIDPLWGVKVAAVVLGIVYVLTFYFILKALSTNERVAFWWTVALLTAPPFIFRLILVKAQPLALILILIGIYCFVTRKQLPLFVVQILYVLTHGSFLMLPVLAGWLAFFDLIFNRQQFRDNFSFYVKAGITMIIGIGIGLIAQPTFPNNLLFYWHQIVTIGILGVPDFVGVGLEWRSISLVELFKSLGVISIPLIVGVSMAVWKRNIVPKNVLRWFWLLAPLCVLSLQSIRNLEFFTPFIIIAVALFFQQLPLEKIRSWVLMNRGHALYIAGILSVGMLAWLLFPLILIFDMQQKALPLRSFEIDAKLVEAESVTPALVLNLRWDHFPQLFYYSNETKFLTGLDPVFLYINNPELYKAMLTARTDGMLDPLLEQITYDGPLYVSAYVLDESPDYTSEDATLTILKADDESILLRVER